jgi:hypothetical protein
VTALPAVSDVFALYSASYSPPFAIQAPLLQEWALLHISASVKSARQVITSFLVKSVSSSQVYSLKFQYTFQPNNRGKAAI